MAHADWFLRAGLKIRHLRLLVMLDDYRQTSKAAAVLNVTQPAVSKTLTDLEAGLGVKLFDRNPRGLTTTSAGTCLVRCARAILSQLTETGEKLDALARDAMAPIRVGVLPATAASLLPACIAKLKQISPRTSVFVRDATMDSLLNELRSGGVEIVVGVLSEIQTHSDLARETLFDDPTMFMVRSKHPLACHDNVVPSMLDNYAWILPPMESLLGESLVDWIEGAGIPRPSNVIETMSFSFIRHYLSVSDAIASVPASVARQPHWREEFHLLPLVPEVLARPIGISWHKERPLSSGALLLIKCLRAVVDESATFGGQLEI